MSSTNLSRFFTLTTYGSTAVYVVLFLSGCSTHHDQAGAETGIGGGRDSITIDMPFTDGYISQCVQGTGDDFSHDYTSTYYDLDFDTYNYGDELVYAPIGGTAYILESEEGFGFGTHINIDVGDGTYIVLGHLASTLIEHGEEVAAGQIIAYEGTTGSSTGDHVHIGRHEGKAWEDGTRGASIEGLSIRVYDNSVGVERTLPVTDFVCDLSEGHSYTSRLPTPLWHPNGALVKVPNDPDVYLLESGALRHVSDEEVFWSYNYSFDDLAIIDEQEFACYSEGSTLSSETLIRAAYDDSDVWMLVGPSGASGSYAKRVRSIDWSTTLKSWGIVASSYSDLEDEDELAGYTKESGYMTFRDGTIVTEEGSSAVYYVSDGVAMPIMDWDTFLLLDLHERELLQVSDGAVATIQGRVGDCTSGSYCLTGDVVTTCGGFQAEYGAAGGTEDDESEEDEEESEEESDDEPEEVEDEPEDEPIEDEEDDEPECEPDPEDDESEPADDLREGLSWIRVDGDRLGLKIDEIFSASVDGNDVAVTGVGIDTTWSYDTRYLVDYDESTDMGWYDFSDGWYRVTLRTDDEWAMYWEECLSSTNASALCHENRDLSHSLCFGVFSGEIFSLDTSECRSME